MSLHLSLHSHTGATVLCICTQVSGEGGWDTGLRWEPNRVLLDPYAPYVSGRREFAKRDAIEQFQPQVGAGR